MTSQVCANIINIIYDSKQQTDIPLCKTKHKRVDSKFDVRKVEIGTKFTSVVTEFSGLININSKQFWTQKVEETSELTRFTIE